MQNPDLKLGGIATSEESKQVVERLVAKYSLNEHENLNENLSNMLRDTYKIINKGFEPTEADLETVKQVIGKTGDRERPN